MKDGSDRQHTRNKDKRNNNIPKWGDAGEAVYTKRTGSQKLPVNGVCDRVFHAVVGPRQAI